MLKKKALNRIFITSVALCIVLVIYTFIKIDDDTTLYDDYIYQTEENSQVVYTLNENNYISKSEVYLDKKETLVEQVRNILEIMVEKNNKNSLLPSYLKPILPQNTKVLSVKQQEDILKIDFSKELYNISEEQSEKMIESIVYTLSEFPNVLGVEISVEGNILKYYPNNKKKLPTVLTKEEIGINKVYELTNNQNIKKVILYYFGKNNDKDYLIPVTKYVNDEREPLEIIVESLANNDVNEKNFISYVNYNTKILKYEVGENVITVNLSEKFYDDIENKRINTMALTELTNSIFDNYDIKKIRFLVNDKKILETEK